MASINGIGTGWRGWRHAADGSSTATLWFTVTFFPLLPLRRYRLRSTTDFAAERFPRNPFAVAGALVGGISWSDPVEQLERLPLSWREVGLTYLWCYLLLPILCAWPVLVGRLAFRQWLPDAGIEPQQWVVGAFGLFVILNCAAVLLVAARRMRGARPGE